MILTVHEGEQDQSRSIIYLPSHTAQEGVKLKSKLQPESAPKGAPPQPAWGWGPGGRGS